MISTADPNNLSKMDMKEELENLYKISQLAGDSYEIWWILNSVEYWDKYEETKDDYPYFFNASSNDHFLSAVIRIHMLNDQSKKVFSIHNFNIIIKDFNDFGTDRIKSFDDNYLKFKQLWKKVMILRHNRFAHISSQMSYSDAFKKANITPNEIKKCISLSFVLLNIVSDYLDLSPKYFVKYVSEDTISLLDSLKND